METSIMLWKCLLFHGVYMEGSIDNGIYFTSSNGLIYIKRVVFIHQQVLHFTDIAIVYSFIKMSITRFERPLLDGNLDLTHGVQPHIKVYCIKMPCKRSTSK